MEAQIMAAGPALSPGKMQELMTWFADRMEYLDAGGEWTPEEKALWDEKYMALTGKPWPCETWD